MAYMSAREMLSGLPVKMAHGGLAHTPSGEPLYGKGATAADLLAAEQRVLLEMEDPSTWDPATAYAAIMESGVSVQDALDAGVAQSTIDAIFTTPAGEPAYGGPAPTATMSSDVQNYYNTIMADDQIDAAERLAMQKIATDQGLSYDDILAAGVDPNILYNIPEAAATTKVCPVGTLLEGQTIGINEDCGVKTATATTKVCPVGTLLEGQTIGINEDCGVKTAAATTKVCPVGTLLEGQTIGINEDCGVKTAASKLTWQEPLPALLPGLTDAEKAAQLAASQAAFTNTQEEYVTPTVYQPLPDNTSVYAAGEESLDREFRDSAPRTEVLDSYGNLTNFDYTPAASLRSATGSGYNWTPPTVTSRPRSLMGADLLARYTGGRAAADLRQLTTGLGNGRTYSDYTGVLQNPGSYGGGLSKSQLYSRMRGLDYQRDAVAAADRQASGARGGISAYLAANPDIAASYEAQSGQLGGQSLEQFARNHYNTTGRAEMAAGNRGLFTLVESTGGQEDATGYINEGGGYEGEGYEGEGEDYSTSNWNQRYDMGKAGGVTRPFAHGGSVKKPQGFADGGTASADLLEKTIAGVPSVARNVYNYGKDVVTAPSPSAKLLADAMGAGTKATLDPVQYGAELLGFDDARQLAIMREAVDINNQMVDANLIPPEFRVQFREAPEGSPETRENVSLDGDEEYFNTINHALFSYYAGQNPIAGLGAQIKEVKQGLQQIDRGNNPRTEYLDYFNNQFGLDLAKQGLSPEEAKNAIIDNVANIGGQGTRGRMTRGEELKAGVDLLTSFQDAKYPWEKFAESVMAKADKLRAE
jgi:hypothetical protein